MDDAHPIPPHPTPLSLWLDRTATILQRYTRRFLAQERYQRRRRQMLDAALKIQRAFRGFSSRRLRNRLLQGRELRYRKFNAQLLSAEEEFQQYRLSQALRRLTQIRTRER